MMVAHHRFSVDAACPACGTSGKIKVTEDAGPPFTDIPRRTFADETQKFRVSSEAQPTIECVGCGASFPGPFFPGPS
jgi:hypothetical protein